MKKAMSNEYNEIFANLDEAIILFSNGAINFCNQKVHEVFKSIKIINDVSDEIKNEFMDLKIFKLFRSGENDDH